MSRTFKSFNQANVARCQNTDGFSHKLGDWSASDWMVATFGELGEAANVLKKLNRSRDGIRGNKETEKELLNKLKMELGDTFIYLDLMCSSLGFTIEEAAAASFNSKSAEILYPGRV